MEGRNEKRRRRRKGGFLACFDEAAVVDEGAEEEKGGGAAAAAAASSSGPFPASLGVLSPSPSASGTASSPPPDDGGRRRGSSCRVLARIVRLPSFVTSLHNGSRRKSRLCVKQPPPPPETAGRRTCDDDDRHSDAVFSSSFLSSSSSSSSTITDSTAAAPPPKHPRKPPAARTGLGSTGFCMVMLLVLFVVIFWGRLCGILWTSTCLCFAVGRRLSEAGPGSERPQQGSRAADADRQRMVEEREKRRVVMEGFLDRGRRP